MIAALITVPICQHAQHSPIGIFDLFTNSHRSCVPPRLGCKYSPWPTRSGRNSSIFLVSSNCTTCRKQKQVRINKSWNGLYSPRMMPRRVSAETPDTSGRCTERGSPDFLALSSKGIIHSQLPFVGSPLKSMPRTMLGYFLEKLPANSTFSAPSSGPNFRSIDTKSFTRMNFSAFPESLGYGQGKTIVRKSFTELRRYNKVV